MQIRQVGTWGICNIFFSQCSSVFGKKTHIHNSLGVLCAFELTHFVATVAVDAHVNLRLTHTGCPKKNVSVIFPVTTGTNTLRTWKTKTDMESLLSQLFMVNSFFILPLSYY